MGWAVCFCFDLLYYLTPSKPECQFVLSQVRNTLDKVGIAITSLCAIHCIMLPVLLPVLPLLGLSAWHNHAFERIILLITMVLGFITLFAGFHRYHKKIYPFYSLFLGGFIYWQKDIFGHDYEHYILIVGASFVVLAHILNIRLCNKCHSCDSHKH
jgi:MerC mercury resistance protein